MKKSFLFFGLLGLGLCVSSLTVSAQTPTAGARSNTPTKSDVTVTRTSQSVPNRQAQVAPASGTAQPAATATKPAPANTTAPASTATPAQSGGRTSTPAPAAQPAAKQKQPAAQPAGAKPSPRAQPVPASATKASR